MILFGKSSFAFNIFFYFEAEKVETNLELDQNSSHSIIKEKSFIKWKNKKKLIQCNVVIILSNFWF